MKFVYSLLLFAAFGCACAAAQCPYVSDDKAKELAVREHRRAFGESFARPILRDDLTQDFLRIQLTLHSDPVVGKLVKPIKFVELAEEGYVLSENRVVSEELTVDNYQTRLVAIDACNARVIPLKGFAEWKTGLDGLLEYISPARLVDDEARALVLLLIRAWYDTYSEFGLVTDEANLRSVALDDFRSRFSTGVIQKYENWWRLTGRRYATILRAPIVTRRGSVRDISVFRYHRGQVTEIKVSLNDDQISKDLFGLSK